MAALGQLLPFIVRQLSTLSGPSRGLTNSTCANTRLPIMVTSATFYDVVE
jgi:hypothetical protein